MQDIIARALGHNAQVTADLANTRLDNLPKYFVYKGAVNYYVDLPSSDNTVGDVWTVLYTGTSGTEEDGSEYAWSVYEGVEQWICVGKQLVACTKQEITAAFETT